MRIGVVRTVGSPCRCAEAIAKGLEALGHEMVLADSEEIELRASELAETCDLVIDHTDTFRKQGLFRPLVRLILEQRGARVVGSDARTCFLADDKIATKARLVSAGIPTPPGVVVTSKTWNLPSWMTPPLVLKPAFEHMSRGLGLARSEEEAHSLADHLIDILHQPVLVESFIPGRELAVSLLEGTEGLEVLPPLEWRLENTGSTSNLLTEAFKLVEPVGERREAVPAELAPGLHEELEAMSRLAFKTLGLRDYARFDIRLSPGGTFFFLEANTTPSLELLEAFPLSARWAALDYPALIERMLRAALHRYGHRSVEERKRINVDLTTGQLELDIPEGVHPPPESSIDLAKLLDVKPGESVLDLGCGSGILSIAAAKLGARRVVATDLDPCSLRATAANAAKNGVAERIEIRAGSWYEALGNGGDFVGGAEKFDVILATPPQTPGPNPFGPRYGGPDGMKHLFAILDDARTFLNQDEGRLWLLAISLANPSALWRRLEERFCEVSLVHETDRLFTAEEYESMSEGLFNHFLALRSQGCSEFKEMGDGKYVFRNLFIRAKGCRP